MVFRVLLQVNAANALRKLDDTNRTRMKKALGELAVDSWKAGKPLRPSDFWGIRAGDYRAIYEINQDQNQVTVIFVGHRKNVYDNFSKIV